ncbi:T9SS type B sorting domain-containing protein [Mariniflexile litorale]|uniref:T9SS type B sorting domain-containing protein n=1 Tax=Mariniflexile litorale TaxID=3045158 RepID=A0AAU7EDM7_9FLAO|nr:T9SS type B sorting domain-containing protein [Mariniflexile sp. KMM 9835]MDQ8212860.1 T9SS type B sorting domain-containing protein [Mariniflexile sp. KMM 9835]
MNFKFLHIWLLILSSHGVLAQQWQQNLKIVEPIRSASSSFGLHIATYEGFAAFEANSVSVGGVINAGKVHMARKECEGWSIYQELTLSETKDYCGFGSALAMDKTTLAIRGCDPLFPLGGAAIYMYERGADDLYVFTQKISKPENVLWDNFGITISISGNYMVVGASYNSTDASFSNVLTNAGAAYIYFRNALGVWSLVQKITASDRGAKDNFGGSVDIYENTIVVGAENEGFNWAGASYVFEKNTNSNSWSEVTKLVAYDFRGLLDRFGSVVKIDKNTIAISAMWEDDNDYVSSGDDGMPLNSLGSVYVFVKNTTGNWVGNQKLKASNRSISHFHFGDRLDFHDNTIAVRGVEYEYDVSGSPIASYGNIYIFNKATDGMWSEYQIIPQTIRYGSDAFGRDVALYGEDLFVGAYWHDYDINEQNFLNDSGAIFLFNPYSLESLKKPEINLLPTLMACEDLGNGFSSNFNMSTLQSDLVDKPEDYTFYYRDQLGNILSSPLPDYYANAFPYSEKIFIRVENKHNSKCFEDTEIQLETLASFNLNVVPELFECDTTGTGFSVFDLSELNRALVDDPTLYEFLYFDAYGNNISNSINKTYQNKTQNQEQITVRVSNKNTSCIKETTITLNVSNVKAYTVSALFSCVKNNSNLVAFNTSNIQAQLLQGQTNREVYYFNEDGTLLTSPLPNPYHLEFGTVKTIKARVENSVLGCYDETFVTFNSVDCDSEIVDFKIPKYFTPNGDGVNDEWKITQEFSQNYIVYIFDRYGKLIKNLGSNNGWDGNFNGKPLPSSDYWYKLVFEDGTNKTGHFTLKR